MCCCFSNSSTRLLLKKKKKKNLVAVPQINNPASKKGTSSCRQQIIKTRQINKAKTTTTITTIAATKKYIFVRNLPENTQSEHILRFFNEMMIRQKQETNVYMKSTSSEEIYPPPSPPPVRNCMVVGRSAYMTVENTSIAQEAAALNGRIQYLGHRLSIGILLPRRQRV